MDKGFTIPEKDVQDVIYKYFGIKDFTSTDKSYSAKQKTYLAHVDGYDNYEYTYSRH